MRNARLTSLIVGCTFFVYASVLFGLALYPVSHSAPDGVATQLQVMQVIGLVGITISTLLLLYTTRPVEPRDYELPAELRAGTGDRFRRTAAFTVGVVFLTTSVSFYMMTYPFVDVLPVTPAILSVELLVAIGVVVGLRWVAKMRRLHRIQQSA